jgi:quercetin dioxygenase-like cupin family protein
VRIPGGLRVLPHTHPHDEVVTVIEGIWYLGIGEKFDETKLEPYSTGSFILIPADVAHFLATKERPVIVQVSGQGMFRTNYVGTNERLIECGTEPSNNKQRTSHGQNGGSPLISVFCAHP